MLGRLCAMAVLVACLLAARATADDRPNSADGLSTVTVETSHGLLRGKVLNDPAIEVFQGIPYAAPPVGELRWKAPRPPANWSGVRDALAPGSPCPQSGRLESTNEDCLYLNVWSPHRAGNRKLPVMVFIHGGGQRESASHEYNADWLITRGTPVVYVSLNYRLNIFAFLAHPALTAEDPQLGSGNYAALDQMQALRWVRENIAAFGGDPSNVTIFGESGGAQAVCVLMASPPARGLFHRAISESGPCQWQYYPSLAASEARGVLIAAELGCDKAASLLECLRRLPVSAILAKERGAQSDTAAAQPAWGGGVLPLPMREAFASGRFARVPFMQGANANEAMLSLATRYGGRRDSVTAAQYPDILKQYLGASRVRAVQEQYPLENYSAPIHALSAVLTDSGMITNNRIGLCNLYLANQIVSPHTVLYSYIFADRTAPYPLPIFGVPGDLPGAAHTKELSYLFHQSELTPTQRRISDQMISYWTQFAANGDPNGRGLPIWPAYRPEEQVVMKFKADAAAADASLYRDAKCRFWSEQGFSSLSGPYPTSTSSGPVYQ